MFDDVGPLHSVLIDLASTGEPLRVFTRFGTFDGLATVDSGTRNVTLHAYRLAAAGLRISGADAAEVPSGNGKYLRAESSPLVIASTAIEGVTSIDTGPVNCW